MPRPEAYSAIGGTRNESTFVIRHDVNPKALFCARASENLIHEIVFDSVSYVLSCHIVW